MVKKILEENHTSRGRTASPFPSHSPMLPWFEAYNQMRFGMNPQTVDSVDSRLTVDQASGSTSDNVSESQEYLSASDQSFLSSRSLLQTEGYRQPKPTEALLRTGPETAMKAPSTTKYSPMNLTSDPDAPSTTFEGSKHHSDQMSSKMDGIFRVSNLTNQYNNPINRDTGEWISASHRTTSTDNMVSSRLSSRVDNQAFIQMVRM